ncbi:MAG: sporulation protein YtxC [Bacillota bacterium]
MALVKVVTNNYRQQLEKRFKFESEILKKDNIAVEVKQLKEGNKLIFESAGDKKQLSFQILREFIANVLSDIIINYVESDFLHKILEINCKQLDQNKREEIINIALNRLNILSTNDKAISAQLERKNRISLKIKDYVEDGRRIMLEGFVQFRLKDYLSKLELAVKNAIEEYGVEKEYEEFIHLLKYYVDTKQKYSKLVNVVKVKKDDFELLGDEKNIIEDPFLDQYILEELEQELDEKDLLISSLLAVAPEEIILHFKSPFELVENLENIFGDSLSICLGCKYCNVDNSEDLKRKIRSES